ncbi:DinB family protein [Catenulispora yoronensis]|uniref:DinB family protein n=1 Tax=Catenulispora yoronensis TaxID=450799 RepID=A0ABN2U1W5_9ACTN
MLTRLHPPIAADERASLNAFLDAARTAIRASCLGVSDADAHRVLLPGSGLTLCGAVSHLRWAEATWFEVALRGERDRAPAQDYLADPDVPLALLLDEYDAQCDLSRVIASTLSLDTSVACAGTRYNVRWILLHMLEETRRVLGLIEAVRELLVGDPVAG